MRDTIDKLMILRYLLLATFEDWRRDVWEKDLDAPYCCRGDPMYDQCGCGGATVREIYTPSNWGPDAP